MIFNEFLNMTQYVQLRATTRITRMTANGIITTPVMALLFPMHEVFPNKYSQNESP